MMLRLGLLLLLGAGPAAAQNFQADNALSVFSAIWPFGGAAQQICKSACRVYDLEAGNNSTTSAAYVKLYNSASATCGSGTPQYRLMIAASSVVAAPNVNGDSYSQGAWVCVTALLADADTTNIATNTVVVNAHFKTISGTNP